MIDFKELFSYLIKKKWVIILIPICCVILTFFLVKNLPDTYSSQTQLSTGLTDQSQQVGEQTFDFYKISQQFGNIMEMVKMKRVMNRLSYRLLLHDLEHPEMAFKPLSDLILALNESQRKELIGMYRQHLAQNKPLSPLDNKVLPIFDIAKSMGYDEASINEDLYVNRNGESDFINIEYLSENPELSAFVVNTLASEFISYYSSVTTGNQQRNLVLLDSLLKEKERAMNEKNSALRGYKESSGVINPDAQSEILFKQISDYEDRLASATRDISSMRGAIANIESKLKGDPGTYGSPTNVTANNDITDLDNKLQEANKRYVDGNFKTADQRTIDSLQRLRSAKIARISSAAVGSTNAVEARANRQSMIAERMRLETSLSLAEHSIASINAELSQLRAKYYTLVPADAGVQNLQRDAELATNEYTEALNRYNQAGVEKSTGLKLNIVEYGIPGPPEPSKRMIYTALSGVASFSAIITALLIAFLLDRSIHNPKQLSAATKLPVFGNINLIPEGKKDLRDIWNDNKNTSKSYLFYKELLRSLRFEIGQAFSGNDDKVLGITSLSPGDGKTFIASGLAYAFAMTGKKVLLIGDDYPNLTELISNKKDTSKPQQFETFLVKKEIKTEDLITVLNRNPNNTSLLEIKDSRNLRAAFDILKNEFDLIIVDMNSMNEIHQVKEWMMFTDKSLAVFKNKSKIHEHDREYIQYLANQKNFLGWVLNKIDLETEI